MSEKKYSAFTLVELMVAMSIIAILIGLSVFGITTAQRNLRDNQRRDAVKNIAAGLADYYSRNGSYPARTNNTFAGIGGSNSLGTAAAFKLTGVTTPSGDSTASATWFGYSVANDGYILCAELESGGFFDLGSSATICNAPGNDITDLAGYAITAP
jgi:prepilin-type N-terminal cleavage/methylation domain-containing protein